jgi:hypothetical protein
MSVPIPMWIEIDRSGRARLFYLYFTEYLVNAPPAWINEFGPSAA